MRSHWPLPRARVLLPVLLSAACFLDVATSHAQPAPADPPSERAAALFKEAAARLDAGDFAGACPLLEDVLRIEPGANGAQMALAECYEGAGRLASAFRMYTRAGEQAAKIGRADRQSEAATHVAALRPRLGGILFQLSASARITPGLALSVDGAPVAQVDWDKPFPADKGAHVVRAAAGGKAPWERTVTIVDGATVSVALDAMEDVLAPPAGGPSGAGSAGSAGSAAGAAGAAGGGGAGGRVGEGGAGGTGGGDGAPGAPDPAPEDRSHARQLGVVMRADVDLLSKGAVVAAGLSYAPIPWVEVSATALLGKRAGLEVDVTGYLRRGSVKPLLAVGAPVLFQDGAYVGVRGGGGVQWDPNRHFGIFATVGGAYFPAVPAGYTRDAVLAALGVQGRF